MLSQTDDNRRFRMSRKSKTSRIRDSRVVRDKVSAISEIFKAYDVRGIYGQNLTEDVAYKIGRAFVYFLKCKDVVVGTDMRLSSPKLSKAFMKGAAEQGANAIFIGEFL